MSRQMLQTNRRCFWAATIAFCLLIMSDRLLSAQDSCPPKQDDSFLGSLPLESAQRNALREFLQAWQFAHDNYNLSDDVGYGKQQRSRLSERMKNVDHWRRMCRVLAGAVDSTPRPEEEPVQVLYEQFCAIQFLGQSRDPEAIAVLIPLLGRPISSWSQGDGASVVGGRIADDALVAIGLPAVDAILRGIADGRITGECEEPARRVGLRVLGAAGLSGRASDLGLGDDPHIKRFLSDAR